MAEAKLIEAMAKNQAFQVAVTAVPVFHTFEDCARAALSAAEDAGWVLRRKGIGAELFRQSVEENERLAASEHERRPAGEE